jgi:hypothetical protein
VVSPTVPQDLEFGDRLFTSWVELQNYALRLQPLGLLDSNPLDSVVLLEPAFFDAKSYDSVAQTFTWDVYDDMGQRLKLSLPFEEWSSETIRTLEGLTPPAESRWQIVANLSIRDECLEAQPISILRPESPNLPIFHLAFDAIPAKSPIQRKRMKAELEDEEDAATDEPSEMDETSVTVGQLGPFLAEFERRLESIAESGASAGINEHRVWLSQSQEEAHRAGLTTLAAIAGKLVNPSGNIASNLLRARYLIHLHAQASARHA